MSSITLRVEATRPYDVIIGTDIISELGTRCREVISGSQVLIITDSNTAPLYKNSVAKSLESAGFSVTHFTFEAGEAQKNADTYLQILQAAQNALLTRNDAIIAVGGGVVGDLTGFAASTYMRGIGFIQVPTSLLAMVDSSVGGKTAIDFGGAKNTVGTFYQPHLVVADINCLETLPEREIICGKGEILKYGIISDPSLFSDLPDMLRDYADSIARCITIKRNIVECDEQENGLRQILNMGHTLGHAVESLSNYKLSHGACVAIGCVAMTQASAYLGMCPQTLVSQVTQAAKSMDLPTRIPENLSADAIFKAIINDKKRHGHLINVVMPRDAGKVSVETLELESLRQLIILAKSTTRPEVPQVDVTVANGPLTGDICAISSKSYAHRALICNLLSGFTRQIDINATSNDIEATRNCCSQIHRALCENTNDVSIDAGESGSTLRFILPVCCALGLSAKITCHGRLATRPMDDLTNQLEANGATIKRDNQGRYITSGHLTSGNFTLPGNVSSQYISGILLAAGAVDFDVNIQIAGSLESAPYVELTCEVMIDFGVKVIKHGQGFFIPATSHYENNGELSSPYIVQGDWSNAAYWICASVLSKPRITVSGLTQDSSQGDKALLDVIKEFGGTVCVDNNCVIAKGDTLTSATIDVTDIPDLVPEIALLAAAAHGETTITGAARLRIKESDRLKTISAVIANLGGSVFTTDDAMVIQGTGKLHGGIIDAAGDHRIAMMGAIASIIADGPVKIKGANAVAKSYPYFFNDLTMLGGNYVISLR